MGKVLKILAGLVLLLVVAIVVVPLVIDPNDYREDIQAIVKEKTGRDLAINGDLSLSVFPWLGIGINNVSLSNAAGFKAEHFAEIREANIKVKLLPLLSEKVEVSTLVLKGMSLHLAKNKAGNTNWDDMVQASGESHEKTSHSEDGTSPAKALGAIAIGGIQVEDANVSWINASKGEQYNLEDLDLTTDAFSLDKPMGMDLALTVDSRKPKATVRLKLNGDMVINSALNKVEIQDLALLIDAAGEPVPNGAMKIDITSHLTADLAGAGSLSLKPLTIKFDDSTLSGNVSVHQFEKPAIGFDLVIDTINVDRYLPKTDDAANKEQASGVAIPPPAAVALIPVQTIRDLNVNGLLNVQSLIVNGLAAESTSVKIRAKNGVLNTEQRVEMFYNGQYEGKTTIDARQNTPRISVKEEVTGVNIEPLLVDLMGESKLSGVANIKAELTTRGNTIPAFKSALNGTANFSFDDGTIKGIDVGALMKQAEAVLKGNVGALAEQGKGETAFANMSGSTQITNGLAKNRDLLVTSPLVNITGEGSANLVSEALDYRLTLQRTKALSEAEKADSKDLKNVLVPVNVAGTFEQPRIQLDVKQIVLETQKEKIDEKKAELKEKLDEKIGEKLKGPAGDLLKSLF
ncbi:MAG: AsmA family protein [Cycloclasticus sp.]